MLMLAYRTNPLYLLILILNLPISVQLAQRHILLPAHSHSLPPSIRLLQELPQSLLTLLQRLRRGRISHLVHRAPEIERVRNVGAHA